MSQKKTVQFRTVFYDRFCTKLLSVICKELLQFDNGVLIRLVILHRLTIFQPYHMIAAGEDKFKIVRHDKDRLAHIPQLQDLGCHLLHVGKVKPADISHKSALACAVIAELSRFEDGSSSTMMSGESTFTPESSPL